MARPSPFKLAPITNDDLAGCDLQKFICASIGGTLAVFSCHRLLMFYAHTRSIEFFTAVRELNLPLKSVLIWLKDNISLNFSEFCFRSEPIIYAGDTCRLRRNKNRGQSNLFYCAAPHDNRRTKAAWYHPTSKPIKLLRDLLDATTIVGDVIVDPFAGTGSGLVACHRTGRKWLGIELDPKYCIATLMRYRYETAKQQPVYEIIDGRRVELSDEELERQFQEYKAQQSA